MRLTPTVIKIGNRCFFRSIAYYFDFDNLSRQKFQLLNLVMFGQKMHMDHSIYLKKEVFINLSYQINYEYCLHERKLGLPSHRQILYWYKLARSMISGEHNIIH